MGQASARQPEGPMAACMQMMEGANAEKGPMAMCPMAKMFKGISEKPFSGLLLLLPGVVLIVVGVLILIEPKILVWLMAGMAILLGIALLIAANFVRRLGVRLRSIPG